MAKHGKPTATTAPDGLAAARVWSITLGISALLLTVMYTAAVMHYGTPHFAHPERVISELAHTIL